MAHTYNNLWPDLVSWGNLLAAYHACRRRKRYKPAAAAFDFAWEENLLELQRELTSGEYAPGAYRNFFITDPKRRKISAAPFRDRVVHHAVVRVLEPIFERRFIFDSYACRRGKGTHRAINRAQMYLRRYCYYLKTDVVRFFPNVDHEVVLGVIGARIRDPSLMALIARIIASGEGVLTEEATNDYFPGDDLFAALRPRGIPIGNLTSQFFANVLLDQVDHFVKDELQVPGYVRYADDLVLLGNDKAQLWRHKAALAERMARLRLCLHPEKTHVAPSTRGLHFLGFVLKPGSRRLKQSCLKRFNRRLRLLRWLKRNRGVKPVNIGVSLRAWLAHTEQANARGIRRIIMRRARF